MDTPARHRVCSDPGMVQGYVDDVEVEIIRLRIQCKTKLPGKHSLLKMFKVCVHIVTTYIICFEYRDTYKYAKCC